MSDSSRISQSMVKRSVRITYKIICYAVAWLAALFATNPNGVPFLTAERCTSSSRKELLLRPGI